MIDIGYFLDICLWEHDPNKSKGTTTRERSLHDLEKRKEGSD
jgi:hypothetical protein